MWGPKPPHADSPSSQSPADPLPVDSLRAPSLLQPSSPQPPSSLSRDSLESPCSPPAPPSLGSLLDSSSLPSDSLEAREGWASFSLDPLGDSLDPAPLRRGALRPLFSLNDTLETSSIQRDSLQSATSTQASSLPSDSLESPCSLYDSLDTSLSQYTCSGSRSV